MGGGSSEGLGGAGRGLGTIDPGLTTWRYPRSLRDCKGIVNSQWLPFDLVVRSFVPLICHCAPLRLVGCLFCWAFITFIPSIRFIWGLCSVGSLSHSYLGDALVMSDGVTSPRPVRQLAASQSVLDRKFTDQIFFGGLGGFVRCEISDIVSCGCISLLSPLTNQFTTF